MSAKIWFADINQVNGPDQDGHVPLYERQEKQMSGSLKIMAVLGFAVFAAGCASQQEEPVPVAPEPVTTEPVYTGKYK